MRGTVHVTSARRPPLAATCAAPSSCVIKERRIELGLVDAVVERAAAASYAVLETAPQGVSRAELIEAWQSAGTGVISSASSEAGLHFAVISADAPAPRWLSPGSSAGRGASVDRRARSRRLGVRREAGPGGAIAARYAWGHGPIDAADLARWTGLTLTEARRRWGAPRVAETAGDEAAEARRCSCSR